MNTPIILLFRRDLRLADHEALHAASQLRRPIIPLFIYDDIFQNYGAAPKWRLGEALRCFSQNLEARGSRLILRKGEASQTLLKLIDETKADTVYWSRAYTAPEIERDKALKSALAKKDVTAKSFPGFVLFEPFKIAPKSAPFFRVYTPMWKAVSAHEVPPTLPPPKALLTPETWPESDNPDMTWDLGAGMGRGAQVVGAHCVIGEDRAMARLRDFVTNDIAAYKAKRDFPWEGGTSRLSENLTYGEISPRSLWQAGKEAMAQGARGAEHFLKEIVWREFATHLGFHTPHIMHANWRSDWDNFPWIDTGGEALERWKKGQTGVDFVDAAMRELYVTGKMHNRLRMVVASYLTKHLMIHWKHGMDWFAETLVDWDPASNAMGWQWTAGSGPDAAPYFRIYNPEIQAEKFDPEGDYRDYYLSGAGADDFAQAIPISWGDLTSKERPKAMITLGDGRARALLAYENHRK